MIKVYSCGKDFINDNSNFLNINKYMSSFFYLDAELFLNPNKDNYAISCENDGKTLLAMKVEPYNLMLYGDKECLKELLSYLTNNYYNYSNIMCSTDIGDSLIKEASLIVKRNYYLYIGMVFMEAKEKTFESSDIVEVATINDANKIYDLSVNFFKDCGLPDRPNIEKIKANINHYRVLRINNEIVSMAAYSYDTDNSCRITHVYTIKECRGNGFARTVVNTLKNEILNMGKIATLNVDQANPISNHLYETLGFKKIYSQGIYILKE